MPLGGRIASSNINHFVFVPSESSRFNLEDGQHNQYREIQRKNNFNLWCIKMHALLKEEGNCEPLYGQPTKIDKFTLEQQQEKMHLLILLSLSNEVLFEVSKEKKCFCVRTQVGEINATSCY